MLVATMTAFSFTSCEDVPAAYEIPGGGNGGNGGSTETVGNGTAENPYTVEDIKKSGAKGSNVFVKAYIVGFVPEKAIDDAKFTAEGCEAVSNVLIAASADETSVDNVMPVQLPVGDVRNAINLKDNPTNIKQEVVLCGNIEAYFGKTGLKSVVWAKLGDKEFGAKPGTEGGSTGGEDKPGEDKPAGNGNIAIDGTTLTLSNPSVQAGATTVEMVPGDFYTENGTEVTTITLKDGTKIVFDANGEKNGPKYYTGANYSNIRVYKNNTITFEGHKAIAKIEFSCDVDKNKNVNCVGNETATVVIDGKKMVYTNVFKEASGGGVQLRITKIVITYAK